MAQANTMNRLAKVIDKMSSEDLILMYETMDDYQSMWKQQPLNFYTPWERQKAFNNSRASYKFAFGGNRSGKTVTGVAEFCMHLAGQYPDWYKGRKFKPPIIAWASSTTLSKLGDIIIPEIFGNMVDGVKFVPTQFRPFGFMPPHLIDESLISWEDKKRGIMSEARLRNGSIVCFKCNRQGRQKFEGTGIPVILLDEEHDKEVVDECKARLITKNGILLMTMTPCLVGKTWVVDMIDAYLQKKEKNIDSDLLYDTEIFFLDSRKNPFLTARQKDRLVKTFMSMGEDSTVRITGIPAFGSRHIYPWYSAEKLSIDFYLPELTKDWIVLTGMDSGGTAPPTYPFTVIWFAINRFSGKLVVLDQYYSWKPFTMEQNVQMMKCSPFFKHSQFNFADPSAGQANLDMVEHGVVCIPAMNDVNSGIGRVSSLGIKNLFFLSRRGMKEGMDRMPYAYRKKFHNKLNFNYEMSHYRRNENGQPIKTRDHGPDAIRYGKIGYDMKIHGRTGGWRKTRVF